MSLTTKQNINETSEGSAVVFLRSPQGHPIICYDMAASLNASSLKTRFGSEWRTTILDDSIHTTFSGVDSETAHGEKVPEITVAELSTAMIALENFLSMNAVFIEGFNDGREWYDKAPKYSAIHETIAKDVAERVRALIGEENSPTAISVRESAGRILARSGALQTNVAKRVAGRPPDIVSSASYNASASPSNNVSGVNAGDPDKDDDGFSGALTAIREMSKRQQLRAVKRSR